MRTNIVILLVILIAGLSNPVVSQNSINAQNLENVKVDDLTDDQIKKYLSQAESSGYSEQQLEVLAKARGMSSMEIAKLRQRIAKIKSGASSSAGYKEVDRSRIAPNQYDNQSNRDTDFDPFSTIYPLDTADQTGLKIFGMDFFNNPAISFAPSLNIATPQDYQLGPGDQLIIDVWGSSEQNYQLEISPEGSIIIPSLGPIYLNGLSMDRAESRIKARLKNIYSTIGNGTFAQVSLGKIRTISVNIIGEVRRPGTYEMSSFATAFNALYYSGGPTRNGSFRNISVFRAGKEVANLDVYNFLVSGEGQNIMLQDQDMLIVKPYMNRVAISGEVKKPAYYELKDGESFNSLLNFSGGFTSDAYKQSISIRRKLANQKTIVTIDSTELASAQLEDGDFIEIGRIQNQYVGRVRIEGAVNHPGEFELSEGMRLSDAVNLTDGFRSDAFMGRAIIIRQNDDLSLSNIAFSPELVLSEQEDLELQSEDLIKIQSIFDLRESYTVSVQGEVLSPGVYPFVEEMTVENLIYLANGFKETAAKSFVEVARRVTDEDGDGASSAHIFNFAIDKNLNLDESSQKFVLKPFDLIVIRKSPFYEKQAIVEVEGEAQYPGKYALKTKTERISDVLKRSGGLTDYAYAKGATLIRRTEYYVTSDEEAGEAARIRREDLKSLLEKDTLVDKSQRSFKTQESIGIRLEDILQNPGSKYDLILKEGDIISIPRELQTVRIRGQVLYPSTVRFDNARSFKQYVSQAGGFDDHAKKSKSYVVYPNGSAERTKSFLWFKDYPKVEPGTEVIIPKKVKKEKLSPQAWISLSSGVATLSLVILRIVDQI